MDNRYCQSCSQRSKGEAALRRLKSVIVNMKRTHKPTKGGRLGIIWEPRVKCSHGLYCKELEQTKNLIREQAEELEQYLCTLVYGFKYEEELRKIMEQLGDYFPIACDTLAERYIRKKK